MPEPTPFVDIHCHLLPGIDDGAANWDETLEMSRMAVADGIGTIVVTPHQLGGYRQVSGPDVRQRTVDLQRFLDEHQVGLKVLPGADVRIEDDMLDRIADGDVLTLADRRRHVLLELPHELYFPLELLLDRMQRVGLTGILSHPERNRGIMERPSLLPPLVDRGCLMQITAGSLLGAFGRDCQRVCEWCLSEGLVHFVSTDAHGTRSRRPLLSRAYRRVLELTDELTARDLCCRFPSLVVAGQDVPAGRRGVRKTRGWTRMFGRRKAA